ncbi:MAG: ATP-binding protein [Deltaproteobacteria bacterium HGW-Deltaproteobacteria-19]|nr:MAG: ATP-binding protein [Deltaproteobacteria bacterium HGW-Deltaproteobacteria-19]
MPEKVLLSWSGGKDCALALQELLRGCRFEAASLLTTFVGETDRVVMHGIPRFLVEAQARSLGLPLEAVFLEEKAGNDVYDQVITEVLEKYRKRGFPAIAFGDLYLEDVRRYRESRMSASGMTPLFPLWGKDTKALAERFIGEGWRAIVTCVDTAALDGVFAGRFLDRDFLSSLPPGVDPCGENGEFHTFVFDGPIFREAVAFRPGELSLRDGRFQDLDLLRP